MKLDGRHQVLVYALLPAFLMMACGQTYPKEKIIDSVKELFQEEGLDESMEAELVGRTLYASCTIEGLVTTGKISENSFEKLNKAMRSLSRIALSTDADVGYTFVQAKDPSWDVQVNLIQRIDDMKRVYANFISPPELWDRIIMEMVTVEKDQKEDVWHDISLDEFMSRWIASKISLASQQNPLVGILLGMDDVSPSYDAATNTLSLRSHPASRGDRLTGATRTFLKDFIHEKVVDVRKKYEKPDWAERVVVQNDKGEILFELDVDEYAATKNTREKTVPDMSETLPKK